MIPLDPQARRRWPPGTPCAKCGTTEGRRKQGLVSRYLADGRRWGFDGALCHPCYARHHDALTRALAARPREARARVPHYYAEISRWAIKEYRRATRTRKGGAA